MPVFDAWARWTVALPPLAVSVVAAWTYPIAAQVLQTGMLDRALLQRAMRGNRLRLSTIFFLLNVAFYQFEALIRPATRWAVQSLDAPISWTLREATIRHVIEFPLDMLWIILWPATIAIVMNALASPPPSAELDRRATRAA